MTVMKSKLIIHIVPFDKRPLRLIKTVVNINWSNGITTVIYMVKLTSNIFLCINDGSCVVTEWLHFLYDRLQVKRLHFTIKREELVYYVYWYSVTIYQ